VQALFRYLDGRQEAAQKVEQKLISAPAEATA
jgi:hypothetical protein